MKFLPKISWTFGREENWCLENQAMADQMVYSILICSMYKTYSQCLAYKELNILSKAHALQAWEKKKKSI